MRRIPATHPFICAAVGAACVATSAARADDAPSELETVSITATRVPTPVGDVPATVTVLDSARIETQLVENIEDLVRYEPGVSVRTSPSRFTAAGASTGRDGNSGFNIRGLDGNRVLIQVDGVRTPDAYSFGGQSVGRGEYVDLGLLKSVEILRGPASALYGSDGVAGTVSFVTRDPADLLQAGRDTALRLRTGYANADESFSQSIAGAARLGGWEMMAAYTRRAGEGVKTQGRNTSANVDRTVANPEDNESNALLLRVVRPLTDSQRVRLTWDHLDRDADWIVLSAIAKPPLASTSVIGLTAFDKLERDRFTVDHFYTPTGSWLEAVRTSAYYQGSNTRQFSAEDRNTAVDRTRDATFDNTIRGVQFEARSTPSGNALKQQWVFGADAQRTRTSSLRTGTVPPVGETFPSHAFPTTDFTLAGVYVQDELRWERVSLFPALRWDYFKNDPKTDALFTAAVPAGQNDSQLSPKIGAVARLNETVNLFVNAAKGYKAPSPNQVNNGFSNPTQFYRSISNPDLKPETSRTLEAGLRVTQEDWNLHFTVFTGRYRNFIDQVQVSGAFQPTNFAVYQFVNLSDARIKGVEARAQLALLPGLRWTSAAAYSRGHSEHNGVSTPLSTIDPLKIVSGLDWQASTLPVGAEFVATHAARKAASRTGISCTGGCYIPGSYTVFDAFGWWRVSDHTTVRAGVFNLGDKQYTPWADARGLGLTSTVKDAYTSPGRNASVSVVLQF